MTPARLTRPISPGPPKTPKCGGRESGAKVGA